MATSKDEEAIAAHLPVAAPRDVPALAQRRGLLDPGVVAVGRGQVSEVRRDVGIGVVGVGVGVVVIIVGPAPPAAGRGRAHGRGYGDGLRARGVALTSAAVLSRLWDGATCVSRPTSSRPERHDLRCRRLRILKNGAR